MASGGLVRRSCCALFAALAAVLAGIGGPIPGVAPAQAQATCTTSSGTTTYAYDALGRLTGTCNTANGVDSAYVYDAADNRTAQTVSLLAIAQPVTVFILQNTPTNVPLSFIGGTPASVAVSTGPSHGSASASGTSITYTPTTGYLGPDSFQYTGTNGSWTSPPATVSITVAVPPIAGAITQTVAANSQYNPVNTTNINLTSVITGGQPTALHLATAPSHGTVTISGLSMLYTPANGYPASGNSAPDSFTYTASNGVGTSAPATVSITVKWGVGIWCPASNPTLVVPGCFAWGSGVLWGGS